MAGEVEQEKYLSLRNSLGGQALAALYPNDFEVYITAIELVDSADKVTDYFLFPLNPSEISKSTLQIQSIKKTALGISTVSTSTYQPSIITMSGNFGKKLKILVNQDLIDFNAFNFSEQFKKNAQQNVFSNTVKTGYGCLKILERIIEKSKQLDQYGNPYFLHLYNLSFGDAFLVKVIGEPSFNDNLDKNMIWSYNIKFQTLAPLNQLENYNKNSNLKQLGISVIQKGLNIVASNVTTSL